MIEMKSRHIGSIHLATTLLLCALCHASSVEAQQNNEAADAKRPLDSPPNTPSDVYINDSFEAADALAKARTLTDQKRWREAAELLQGASDAMADRVVRTPRGYLSLRSHVSDIICGWPDDGIRAYQNLYDAKLQRELQALGDAPDVDAAVRLFDQYFCTTGAAAMADRIAQFAMESGDLPLAQWVLKRVLDQHPAARTHASRYQNLIALTSAMMGDAPVLAGQSGESRLRWKGREHTLSEAIAEINSEFRAFSGPAGTEDWPLFGGNAQRNRDANTTVDEPGLLWRYAYRPPSETARSEGIIDGLTRSAPEISRGPAIFPAVAGDFVYVQVNRDIAAVRRNSGALAWSMRSEEQEGEASPYIDDKPLGGESPVVDDGRLFAALPANDTTYYDYETARTVHELVALDALTGALLWKVTQKGVDAQGTATAYDSAPLARNGRVYIVSRRRRSFGFEDCYLDAYRAADGKLLFRTHLASASTSALSVRGATRSIAAMQGDSIYVCTNLGTVAAVGAYTGGVRWLHLYDRLKPDAAGSSGWRSRDAGGIPINPLIWSSQRIVALPSDSAHLLVLDDRDGKPLYDIPVEKLSNMYALYGVRGDVVCGLGEELTCHDLGKAAAVWSIRFADESAVIGRGMWMGDELIIPQRDGLGRVRVEDGRSRSFAMGSHYEGGTVLALPEQILMAGSNELLCYVRKAEIWKNIQERMASSPDDPLPALEFAEVALGAGEISDALFAMQEAVRRIKPSLSTAAAALRTRVFTDTLKLLSALPAEGNAAAIDRLFQYASESAGDLASQVEYRFRFAEYFETAGDPRRAIRLYQQVLRDKALREWPPARADATVQRSHVRAAARIAELIKRSGAEVYAEFEAEARNGLEAARAVGDEAALEQLIEIFPNSSAASTAMVAYAELLARTGRHEAGARAWERAYNHQRDAARRQETLLNIAEGYERADKPELAYLWLAKAAREFPAATFEQDGRTTTFAAWRDRLRSAKARVEPSRPRLSLPIAPAYQLDLVGTVHLLSPEFADAPETHWSHIYVQNPDGIRGYQGSTGSSLWTQPAPVRMNAELLTARPDFALFATPFEVFAIEASTGARRYSHGEYPARLADPGADWEDGTSFRVHGLHGDRLVSVREDGVSTCLDIRTGELLWSVTRRPAPLGPMRLNGSVLAYHISRDGRAVIHVASASTGELLDTIVTDELRPVDDLHITLDGFYVMVTSKTLSCYDADRQERKWQVSLNWPVRRATLQFDMDSAYFIDDAGVLKKISLEDGRTVWESERILTREEENETLQREGEYLFVSTQSSISAVDVANGLLLWQGTTPDNPHFVQRLLTGSYLAALHAPTEAVDGTGHVYFYDHRNASGVIPKAGGVLDLGVIADVRVFLAVDGAIVVQIGSTIRGFTQPK